MTDPTRIETAAAILGIDPAALVVVKLTDGEYHAQTHTGTVLRIDKARWDAAAGTQPEVDEPDDPVAAAGAVGPLPGGMYQFPDGTRVRGRDAALEHAATIAAPTGTPDGGDDGNDD